MKMINSEGNLHMIGRMKVKVPSCELEGEKMRAMKRGEVVHLVEKVGNKAPMEKIGGGVLSIKIETLIK